MGGLAHRVWRRHTVEVYAYDLQRHPSVSVPPGLPVVFKIDASDAVTQLASDDPRFELSPRDRRELPDQLKGGEVCVSGWVDDALVFYLWLQFRCRRLAGSTTLRIGRGRAFIYRCLTVKAYRGQGIFSSGLVTAQQWLRARGYERVFVETADSNLASRRAIERVGFQRIDSYRVHRLLGRRWATYAPALAQAVTGEAR